MKKLFITLNLICVFMLSVAFVFTSGCKKDEFISILHAGGGYGELTYLNAQETFEGYYKKGYRWFEYDLQLSTDGRIIGTHAWEHLSTDNYNLTYDEFKALRLDNGFTPVNEEWLIETILKHKDVKIVVDAKMPTTEQDAEVLKRLEKLNEIYNCDISSNIIPEIFSVEMWNLVKDTTTFKRFFFSHYKVYYSVEYILEQFADDRIYAIALPIWCDDYFLREMHRFQDAGKKIVMFTAQTSEDASQVKALGVDGAYLDDPNILK